MERPGRYQAFRYLGDKRFQVVYDLDEYTDSEVIEALAGSPWGQTFAPDSLAEARNRGYQLRQI